MPVVEIDPGEQDNDFLPEGHDIFRSTDGTCIKLRFRQGEKQVGVVLYADSARTLAESILAELDRDPEASPEDEPPALSDHTGP